MLDKYFKKDKLFVLVFLIGVFICIMLVISYNEHETKKYHILLIHSFDQNCKWKDEMNNGVKDCFEDNGVHADIQTFYLNAEYLPAQAELDTLNFLMDQYLDKPLDLILVCDDQATFSLLATNHPLSHKIPIVFSGVDYVNNKVLAGHTNITGFTTKPNFVKCYHLAQKLFGRIDDLAIIAEDTYLGRVGADEARSQFENYQETATIYNSFPNYNKTDTIRPLSSIEYPLHIRIERVDKQEAEVLKKILFYRLHSCCILPKWSPFYSALASMGTAPFLMVNNEGFGDGRIGGYMTPSYNQTYDAADLGIKLLRGGKITDFPITASKQYPVFDWDQLKYWKINLNSLPPDSIIPNMPLTVKYKKHIWFVVVFVVVLVMSLFLVLMRLYKREALNKKRIRNRLSKEQLELSITIDALDEGVVYLDRKGTVLSINRAALQWLKLSGTPDIYVKCNIRDLFNIQNKGEPYYLQNLINRMARQQDSCKLSDTAVLITTDKHIFPVSGNISSTNRNGDFYGVIITFRDVTDEYSEKEFLALSMVAGDVFAWRYDNSCDYVMFDESFFHSFNIPHDGMNAISAQKFRDIIYPEDYIRWKKAIKGISSGKITKSTIQIRQDFNGMGYQWWEYRITSLPKSSLGNHYKLFGLCLNVDRFKKIEEELVRVRDEARESDRMKGVFLANMSHEVRTPLNSIVGFSTLLIEDNELGEDERGSFIEIINENCRLLLNLINEILDISRVESGILFRDEECNLTQIVEDSIEASRSACPDSVCLKVEVPEEPVCILGDKFRLKQLLDNLIDNAFKFTEQGSVTVGYILSENLKNICIYVRDTGIGISEQEIQKIFNRFYKTNDFVRGGGLGLSICKEIVRRLGGVIRVESTLDKGSCFIVEIPFKTVCKKNE
ncbi:ATP-binding protein [Parabacteroides chinchillae]